MLILAVPLAGALAAHQPAQSQPVPQLLHPLFQDHAVLQRGRPINVYGQTLPGAAVAVTLGTEKVEARADTNGQWTARLPALAPGGPYTLTASANGETSTASDVFVGDVFFCSGQSNMAFSQRQAQGAADDARLATDADIRHFNVPAAASLTPRRTFGGSVSTWASLREAQRQTALADKHAAIAVTVDIGDPSDLHPTNKREVGRRLSIAARHLIYGERIAPSGPVVDGVRRSGTGVVISFRDVTGPLTLRSSMPSGFELCGDASASCRWADARVDGRSVVLSNAAGATRVRYAWGGSPVCPLFDGRGLPAGPFEIAIR